MPPPYPLEEHPPIVVPLSSTVPLPPLTYSPPPDSATHEENTLPGPLTVKVPELTVTERPPPEDDALHDVNVV